MNKVIDADKFWNCLISVSENDWVGFDTIDEVLSGMPTIDNEIINDAHNEGYDVGYWAGRRDYEPKWIPCSERMPDKEGLYLITCVDDSGAPFVDASLYDPPTDRRGAIWDFPNVIAWMPRPIPYKGGEEE